MRLKTFEMFGPSIFRPAHSGFCGELLSEVIPVQVQGAVEGFHGVPVAAVCVCGLQLDDAVLSDGDRGITGTSMSVSERAGSSSTTVMSKDSFGGRSCLRQADLAAELVLEVNERPGQAPWTADRISDLPASSLGRRRAGSGQDHRVRVCRTGGTPCRRADRRPAPGRGILASPGVGHCWSR